MPEPCKCAIIGEAGINRLVSKYIGTDPANLTSDEREILLFALFTESEARGGLVTTAMKSAEVRLAAQQEKFASPLRVVRRAEEGKDA